MFRKNRPGRRRGFVLVTAAVAAVAILGMTGLCLDLARLYIAKNELQNYADSAAIAAANVLDGTATGITNATAEAQQNANKWYFDNSAVSSVAVDFSTTFNGAFSTNPNPATGYAFARVRVQGSVPVYFLPIFSSTSTVSAVSALAVAGQSLQSSLGDNLFPYSPDAHVPNPLAADPTGNFGYIKGDLYTLRWDPVGKGSKIGITDKSGTKLVGCSGDMSTPGFIPGSDNNGQRGYIDLLGAGGGGGAAFIRSAIVGSVEVPTPLQVGDPIDVASGNKQTEVTALLNRIAQDTNSTTATYYTAPAAGVGMDPPGRTYYSIDPPGLPPASPPHGNGRRVVTMPVNDPTTNLILGFAQFFLPPTPCPVGAQNTQPCCGEYIGPATTLPASGGGLNGSGSPGLYQIRLFQ
ncbi:MAG TPA: pilus assembly protein TadG-related protein [Bryobacterales bacterium]|nr:pilus assembly protein TadG-related protein [Bryobacterales bacterium]